MQVSPAMGYRNSRWRRKKIEDYNILGEWDSGLPEEKRWGAGATPTPGLCAPFFALARKSFDCDMPVSHLRGYTGRHFFAERMHKEKATPICQLEFGAGAVLTEP